MFPLFNNFGNLLFGTFFRMGSQAQDTNYKSSLSPTGKQLVAVPVVKTEFKEVETFDGTQQNVPQVYPIPAGTMYAGYIPGAKTLQLTTHGQKGIITLHLDNRGNATDKTFVLGSGIGYQAFNPSYDDAAKAANDALIYNNTVSASGNALYKAMLQQLSVKHSLLSGNVRLVATPVNIDADGAAVSQIAGTTISYYRVDPYSGQQTMGTTLSSNVFTNVYSNNNKVVDITPTDPMGAFISPGHDLAINVKGGVLLSITMEYTILA